MDTAVEAILPSFIESRHVVTLVVAVLVFLLVYLIKPKNLPPGPLGWPLLGYLPGLFPDPLVSFSKLADKYGKILSIRMGPQLVVMLSDYETLHKAYVKMADEFSDNMIMSWVLESKRDVGSLFWENGERWRQRRRFSVKTLRGFGFGKRSLEARIHEEGRFFCREMERLNGQPVVLNSLLFNASSNIICAISLGTRYDYHDKAFEEQLAIMTELIEGVRLLEPANIIPPLWHTRWYKRRRGMFKAHEDFIREHLKYHKATLDPDNIRDMMDAYLVEMQRRIDTNDPIQHTEEGIVHSISDLFGAGTGTLSNTTLWIIIYMLRHPEIQKKIQEEVDRAVGADGVPSTTQREEMPFTCAFLMEIQRLRPLAAIIFRHLRVPVKLCGYNIPKDTPVFGNVFYIQNSPKFWDDPLECRPERFLSADGKTLVPRKDWIPFGLGRRMCLGEALTKMELFIFTVTVMQRFTFKVPDGDPLPPLDLPDGGLVMYAPKFRVCCVKR
ncbi:cytochrome P450 2U1-like [Acanthaster planci]|uniref:Cytochrome P450 2U1-like n=1 Tax=Acanthaster planci TaxID=133434 RepID=A0A8B7XNR9_ACAPL|nr:cytochrome P450 2U1-like [Acanthaster planci]